MFLLYLDGKKETFYLLILDDDFGQLICNCKKKRSEINLPLDVVISHDISTYLHSIRRLVFPV